MKFRELTCCIILFLAGAFTCCAQDDAYKAFLKRTSVAIHKAQKTMLVNNKTDVGGKLAKAVLLQSQAVKLYEQKKQNRAACSSALARQAAAEIIKELSGKEDVFCTLTDEEKKLLIGCPSETELLKEGKSNLKNLSENDKDYINPKSLNNTNIDF